MCRLADAIRAVLAANPDAVVLMSLPVREAEKTEWKIAVFRGVAETTATCATGEEAIEAVAEAIRRCSECR